MMRFKTLYAFSIVCSTFFCAIAYFNNTATEATELSRKIIQTHKSLIMAYHNSIFDRTAEVKHLIQAFEQRKIDTESLDASLLLYNLVSLNTIDEGRQVPLYRPRAIVDIPKHLLLEINSQPFIKDNKVKSLLSYAHIVSLPYQNRNTTFTEIFGLRKSLISDYRNVFQFDYTVLARDKTLQWHLIVSSLENGLPQEILSSLQKEHHKKLAQYTTFLGNTMDQFETLLDGKKMAVMPVPLHPSADREQLVLYTLPYPQNATKLHQQILILCVFILSLLISSAAYFITVSKPVNS